MSFYRAATAALVAISLGSAPAVAAPSAASSISVGVAASERAGAELDAQNNMGGMMGGGIFIPLAALAAVLLGILVFLDDDDADSVSP